MNANSIQGEPRRMSWAERLGHLLSGREMSESNSRRTFLRSSAVASIALPAVGMLSLPSSGHADDGVDDFRLFGNDFRSIRKHEEDHVQFLLAALGANARPEPIFQNLEQKHIKQFVFVSQALENTGSGAYAGAAPYFLSRDNLGAATTIALIEGRHAGWLNDAIGNPITGGALDPIVDRSFERALSAADVGNSINSFIAGLNGGPPITYSTTPSAANDIAILNFALALEFLEARFYEVNVPKFYPRNGRNNQSRQNQTRNGENEAGDDRNNPNHQ